MIETTILGITMNKSLNLPNIHWQSPLISRYEREARQGHRALAVWFTGLSGSGKSTLAYHVEKHLYQLGYRTVVLDGDNIRHGLCADIGFSQTDRTENIRRVAEVSKLFVEAGVIVLAAFISPFSSDRERVRAMFERQDFIEVHCDCSLDICESRDVKGLYKKARAGQIPNFTGISSAYEAPQNPELYINTEIESLVTCTDTIVKSILDRCRDPVGFSIPIRE